jgi:hypothetical protein
MKLFYTTTLFSFCISCASLNGYADTNLSDFNAQINSIAKDASTEIDQQMAITINLSGKQRMLTQKIAKEALLISLNIQPEDNKKNLVTSSTLFSKTLAGLAKGDTSLKLTKTTDTEILAQLTKVQMLWSEFKPHIEKILSSNRDADNKEALNQIATLNMPLLKEMNKIVGMYAANSGAELDELATIINLSGKQRMLTQKMTKELLFIATDIDPSNNTESLKKTILLFDRTLKGLIKGDKALDLPATKDKGILDQLAKVESLWNIFKAVLEKKDTSPESLKKAAELNLPLLAEMNKAVSMYEAVSSK